MLDPDLLELLDIYADHIEKQGEIIVELIEKLRKAETDLAHYRNMERFDEEKP